MDKFPTRCVPIVTEDTDELVGTSDEIFEKTFSPVTVTPAAPAVKTSVCDFPN